MTAPSGSGEGPLPVAECGLLVSSCGREQGGETRSFVILRRPLIPFMGAPPS